MPRTVLKNLQKNLDKIAKKYSTSSSSPVMKKKNDEEEDGFVFTDIKKTTASSNDNISSSLKSGEISTSTTQNTSLSGGVDKTQKNTPASELREGALIKNRVSSALEEKFGIADAKKIIDQIDDAQVEKSVPVAKETVSRNISSGKISKYKAESYPYMHDAFAVMYAKGGTGDKLLENNLYKLAYMEGKPASFENYSIKEKADGNSNNFYDDYLNNKHNTRNSYNKPGTLRTSDYLETELSNIHKLIKDNENKAIEKIVEQSNVSFEHAKIMHFSNKCTDIPEYKWTNRDIAYWKTFGGDKYINSKKLAFIENYKDVIIDASKKYDIPPLLLAGVAYIEFGADPMWLDDVAYTARDLYDYLPDSIKSYVPNSVDKLLGTDSEKTSFGNTSIQVRRALEMLGYDDNDKNRDAVIASLKNPIQNIYMTACHLDELRNVDFKGKSSSELSEDEIKIIASRYNIGPEPAINAILTEYGDRIYNNEEQILKALGLN